MDLIHTLKSRRSTGVGYLTDPAPSDAELNELLTPAMSAPDHGAIRPWRFKIIRGESRHHLGRLFETARRVDKPDATEDELETLRQKPLRAPLVIAICAEIMEGHPKVPPVEQIIAAGCATQNILLAIHASPYAGVLLTGWMAHHDLVKEGLGLASKDVIIGFLHLGSQKEEPRIKKRADVATYLERWPAPTGG